MASFVAYPLFYVLNTFNFERFILKPYDKQKNLPSGILSFVFLYYFTTTLILSRPFQVSTQLGPQCSWDTWQLLSVEALEPYWLGLDRPGLTSWFLTGFVTLQTVEV